MKIMTYIKARLHLILKSKVPSSCSAGTFVAVRGISVKTPVEFDVSEMEV